MIKKVSKINDSEGTIYIEKDLSYFATNSKILFRYDIWCIEKDYAFVLISVCDSDNLTSHVTDEAVVVVTITEADEDAEYGVPLDTLDCKMVKMKLDT